MIEPDKMWREPVPKSPMYPSGGSFYHETNPNRDGCVEYTRTAAHPVTVEVQNLLDAANKSLAEAIADANAGWSEVRLVQTALAAAAKTPGEWMPPKTDYEAIARMAADGDADPIGTAKRNYPHLFPQARAALKAKP